MKKSEQQLPIYIMGFALSIVIMGILCLVGILAKSQGTLSAAGAFAIAAAGFLAGGIYWGWQTIK